MILVLFGVFFASGFAALLYQVIWQRMLALFSGADVFSVTLIVAAFMAGLGAGNLVGGSIADRLGRRACLMLFAAAEAAIAVFAWFSKSFYYDFLYARFGAIEMPVPLLAAVLFASVLWPTFFMGLSLPLLARAMTTSLRAAARTVSSLYGWNTLGAAAGALITTWVLLRHLDFETCLKIGAAINLACALSVLALGRAASTRDASIAATSESAEPAAEASIFPTGAWLGVYMLSGTIALSLEIAWFRVLGVMLKSTSFTFGTLLGTYLSGVAIGSLAGSRRAERCSGRQAALRFLGLQTAVAVYAGLAVAGVAFLLGDWSALAPLVSYLSGDASFDMAQALTVLTGGPLDHLEPGTDGGALVGQLLALYVGLPALLVGPPTFLMGYSFPFLQRAVQNDARRLGRRVGWLQTANIAGSLLGSLVTGFALLPLLGTAATFRVIAAAALAFAGFAALAGGRRTAAGLAAAATLAALVVPDGTSFWSRLHSADPARILFVEDASGVSVLRPSGADASMYTVMAGGLGLSKLPFGRLDGTHTLLGALPILLHPSPKRVAVIGLGSGDTAFAAAGRPETEQVEAIEIIGSQLALLREFESTRGDPGLSALFDDARIGIHIDDGRSFLRREQRYFDVIEADALLPTNAYAGNLYSREYFALLRDRLAPGGFAVTWLPTPRVLETFVASFPFVTTIGDIAIGSMRPFPIDRGAIVTRASEPAVRDHYARAGIDIVALLRRYLSGADVIEYTPRGPIVRKDDLNHDLFAKDEFLVRRPQ